MSFFALCANVGADCLYTDANLESKLSAFCHRKSLSDTMSIETELKLRVADAQFARLKRQLKKHQITKPVTRRLHNVYFDTPELDLHQRKIALRLRRVGGKWLQTVKNGGSVKAGLHQRDEWEVPVSGARLDFSRLYDVLSNENFPLSMCEKLRPLFTTDFYRTSQLIDWQGACIEVCMDHGEIRTEQNCASLSEVELELKSGEPRQLFALAEAVLAIVPFELESVSKAEKGFLLLVNFVPHPVKAELPKLAKTDELTDRLQALIWSCLMHLQDNLQGAIAGDDPEYLHQVRVALRRLRVVMRMSEKIHTDIELSLLRDALAKLSAMLGRVREWDVFSTQTLKLIPEQSGLRAIAAYAARQRSDCYVEMPFREVQHLLLRFAIWMNGDYWQHAKQCEPPILEFASKHLQQLHRRYVNVQVRKRDASQLHALRIQAKKLRYSAEFFSACYDTHKVKRYLSALSRVQELLGTIHDIYVAKRLFDEMVLPRHGKIIASFKVRLDVELSEKLKSLNRQLAIFDRRPVFWKL